MEYPIFSVYLGQTDSISEDLLSLSNKEIEAANLAVLELLRIAVCDAQRNKFKKQYCVAIENITVAASARRSGKKLFLVLVSVSPDDDWDPDGGEGLDHVAYAQINELAKAFATVIGGRVNFRWISRRSLQLNNINPLETFLVPRNKLRLKTSVVEHNRLSKEPLGFTDTTLGGDGHSIAYFYASAPPQPQKFSSFVLIN